MYVHVCIQRDGTLGFPQQACDVLAEWHINGCVCYFKYRYDDGFSVTYGCVYSVKYCQVFSWEWGGRGEGEGN